MRVGLTERHDKRGLARWLLLVCVSAWPLTGATASQTLSPTLERVKLTGVITLGYRDGSIPFSFLDERQRPVGYSMDICYRIVEAVRRDIGRPSLQAKLVPVNSATRLPLLANRIIDLECGTTTNTVERQETVAFAITTFVAQSRFATRRGVRLESTQDLRGKTVVSTAGSTSMHHLLRLNEQQRLGMTILVGKDHLDAFRMVETDRAVAFAMDDVLLHGLIANSSRPADYVVTGESLSIEPYGIGLPKGDPEFKRVADHAIESLFRSGEIHGLYKKWFEMPIPPRSVALRLPMSDALKRVIQHPTDSGRPEDYR